MRTRIIMEGTVLIILVLVATNLIQELEASSSQDEKSMVTKQLLLINKPSIKSFMTKYGDIVDCVEIDKQFAFDHPLLKNHSIQMKPNVKVYKQTTSTGRSSTLLTPSQLLPRNMRCPRGTVPIKRVQEEEVAMQKFSSLLGMKFSITNSTKFVTSNISYFPPGHQIATLTSVTVNIGVSGIINVWSHEVAPDQLTDAAVFVASDDGSDSNGISAGWAVYPNAFGQNASRFYGYWTKDSGKSTGCFNGLCPGFVQVSQNVTLGLPLQPTSTYGGDQFFVKVSIKQDLNSKNWWLFYGDEGVGYWPKELFGTLADGATRSGWGGEIYSPPTEARPAMGSGHFPDEGPTKACVIYGLSLFGPEKPPMEKDLRVVMSKPDCYKVKYAGDSGAEFGRYMLFGGPPNCTTLS